MSTKKRQQDNIFDHYIKLCHMKLLKRFNIGIKNNIFRSAFKREFDITEDELMALTNFQKAFIYIRDKDLPTPEENWELISSRQASQILLGRYSHQAIIDMAKVDKVFRLSGTKLYKKEIDLYLKYLIWEDAMYGTGFLMDSKDDLGRDVIVVLKKSIKKDGKPEFKQRMAALEQSIKDPQVWAFMEKLRSIN